MLVIHCIVRRSKQEVAGLLLYFLTCKLLKLCKVRIWVETRASEEKFICVYLYKTEVSNSDPDVPEVLLMYLLNKRVAQIVASICFHSFVKTLNVPRQNAFPT